MQSIVKKNDFIVLPTDNDPNEKKHEAWQKLRDAGMSCAEVATVFGVSLQTIRKYTKTTVNLHYRCENARREIKRARMEYYIPLMLKMRELGYSNADIANKTGFCRETIHTYIGKQPDEITLSSYRAAGAKRKFRNLAAKNQPCRDNNEPIPAVADILPVA